MGFENFQRSVLLGLDFCIRFPIIFQAYLVYFPCVILKFWRGSFMVSVSQMYLSFLFLEWLVATRINTEFETMDEIELCHTLRKIYAALAYRDGKAYSKSSIIGIRGDLQRYLTGERVQRVINTVTGPDFKAVEKTKIRWTGREQITPTDNRQ